MAHSQTLNDALETITSEESTLTLEERIDALGREIIANAFYLIDKNSNGQKTTPEENEEQEDMIKRFNEVEKVYTKLKKANRIPNGGGAFDKDLLESIKKRKSSISTIVIANVKEGI